MIELIGVTKKYGDKCVYKNFDLSIESGKITAVLGESGSGKTTLLNVMANLTEFSGKVTGVSFPVSFVFQRDRLVKGLTVKQNLELIEKSADITAELNGFGLEGCENKYPKQLSAGMARRVAILRALLFKSETLFMDEPFVNLDIALKHRLIKEVKSRIENQGKTTVFVTHDIKEAVSLADRIIVLSQGKIIADIKEITEKTEGELFDFMLSV